MANEANDGKTDATASPKAEISEEAKQRNTDKLMMDSELRQQQRGKEERDSTKRREAENALIFESMKALGRKHPHISIHALWSFISVAGLTPRLASADLFTHRIFELAQQGAIRIVRGNPSSATTKIIIAPLQYRID